MPPIRTFYCFSQYETNNFSAFFPATPRYNPTAPRGASTARMLPSGNSGVTIEEVKLAQVFVDLEGVTPRAEQLLPSK